MRPGPLAQLAEQGTLNPKVIGSIPIWPTIRKREWPRSISLAISIYWIAALCAGVAELVDAQGLGPCEATRGGSSPLARTIR